MTELKKTLKQGTPGAAAHPIITPKATPAPSPSSAPAAPSSQNLRSPIVPIHGSPSVPIAGTVSISPERQRAPTDGATPTAKSAQAVMSPGHESEPVSSSGAASRLPPEPTKDELGRTRPPEGSRTPSATRNAPDFGPPLPENAPGWMLRARRMSLALEGAIRADQANPSLEASIERAWAALELDGSTDKQIARVARLVEKAHGAIRETSAEKCDRAYVEIAQVIWAGLPRHVKSRQEFAQVILVVRDLRNEADPWAAVVDATAKVLGWSHSARAHSAQAVRVAILSEKT
jgi:hypothetical protein